MAPNLRFFERRRTVIVSGVAPSDYTAILPATSGYQYSVTNIVGANLGGATRSITFIEDTTAKLGPQITLGASGTLIWDNPGWGPVDLTISSGLNGQLDAAGQVEVTCYYYLHDERTPITKSTARATTYTSATAIRVPNIAGNQ